MNKQRPFYVITGRPGIGKSTFFIKIINLLGREGFKVGGIQSPEVRGPAGRRIGFRIKDLYSGDEGWLARRNYPSPIRVGAYGVVIQDAERIIRKALGDALSTADVIGVDEVGPMELRIPVFRDYLMKILDSDKPLILVVHYRLRDPRILGKLEGSERIVLTYENRDYYSRIYPAKILESIKRFYGRV